MSLLPAGSASTAGGGTLTISQWPWTALISIFSPGMPRSRADPAAARSALAVAVLSGRHAGQHPN